ncbi:MAG: EAL domain-containing protein [Gammaproteobacteria bacterium]|nr:EAL domain-containing protein [Gammaproteobacteria bacterium]
MYYLGPDPSQKSLFAEIRRLREELAKVKVDSMLSVEQYNLLFQNLPLGAQEEDYSPIKKEVDRLKSDGVENLEDYFLSNPVLLRNLVSRVKITSVNKALLDIHSADSKEDFLREEVNLDKWWNDKWVEYYSAEIAFLAENNTYFEIERIDTNINGDSFVSRSISFLVAGYEESWERVIILHEDISVRKKADARLRYQASHDSLTDLINRSEFEHRVKRLLSTLQQRKGSHALCFLDLDQFKVINDTCGHIAGDELLRQLARVLQEEVRNRDNLSRLGGDEFGVLMEDCSLEQAIRVTNTLQQAIEGFQFYWEGQSFRIGVSIGLVAINQDTTNFIELMKQADTACFMAKDLGRNRIHIYQPNDADVARRLGQMQLVAGINRALEENRFCLYAQPIVSMNNSSHRHYEMLLRMTDENGSIVGANIFMSAAERYGLMGKLDCWVIENALALLVENPTFFEEIEFVSINLSGESLSSSDFLDFIVTQLDNSGIDASKICFEVTETLAISNLPAATNFISTLKAIGCYFALDDFGSGLSSFEYLKNLEVDYLKIDGMFVKDIVDDPIDRALVKSINEIGQIMGLKTIAEYVESDEIRQLLKEIGVDYVQGNSVGEPKSFDEIIDLSVFKIPTC